MSPPPKAARPTASAALGPLPSPVRGHTPSSPSSLLSHQDAQARSSPRRMWGLYLHKLHWAAALCTGEWQVSCLAALGPLPSPVRDHNTSSPSSLLSLQDVQTRTPAPPAPAQADTKLLHCAPPRVSLHCREALCTRFARPQMSCFTHQHSASDIAGSPCRAAAQVNAPSTAGLTGAAPSRYSEASTSTQDPPMSGWGAPKQPPPASQPSSLAPGMLSQSIGNTLLSSLQVSPLPGVSVLGSSATQPVPLELGAQ